MDGSLVAQDNDSCHFQLENFCSQNVQALHDQVLNSKIFTLGEKLIQARVEKICTCANESELQFGFRRI